MKLNKFTIIILTLSIILGVVSSFYLRGSFLHFLIAVIFSLTFISSLLLTVIDKLIKRESNRKLNLFPVLLFCTIQIASFLYGEWLNKKDIIKTMKFCESLSMKIDEYYKEHAMYPKRIYEINLDSLKIPRNINLNEIYFTSKEGYGFYIMDHARFLAGYVFDSKSKNWRKD